MRKSLKKSFVFLKKNGKSKGKQFIMTFLNMFKPREDASVIDSSCKRGLSVTKE